MLLTLSKAAKEPGAPKQQTLHRMTDKKQPPTFLVSTEKGWRVETDSPEWEQYKAKSQGRSMAQKLSGNHIKKSKELIKTDSGSDDFDEDNSEKNQKREKLVRQSAEYKIIYNAQREKLKMQQDEIKTMTMKGAFIEKAEAEYWLSFMQRGITDSFSVVKRNMKEVKRLIINGDDTGAERYLSMALKAAFERTIKALRDTIEGGGAIDD